MATILRIDINKIKQSPYQGRMMGTANELSDKQKKKLEELKNSIKQNGLLQPISVVQRGDEYELIDGHRRVAAYRALGRGRINAIISDLDDKQTQVMSLVANLQRDNLNNIERALAFQKVLDTGVFANRKELSKAIGKDETYVGDTLNLLNMDKRIIEELSTHNTTNDVRLLRLIRKVEKTDENGISDKQYDLYKKAIYKKLSRADVQKLVAKNKTATADVFSSTGTYRKKVIQIHQKLTKPQQQKFEALLKQKLDEIMQQVMQESEKQQGGETV
jgi:ParB family chromosome partitioning protein